MTFRASFSTYISKHYRFKMNDDTLNDRFLELLEENRKLIYKVSCLYCESSIDKKDLFQEIVVNLWKAYPEFKGNSKISTWVYRISLNTAITWLRDYTKYKNRIEYTDLIPNLIEDSELENLHEKLYAAISHLGKIDKAIILLQLDGYTYDDISEIVGLTKTNVATKINRIKDKLRTHFLTFKN